MRGLAALSVVIWHYGLLFEAGTPYAALHTAFMGLQWTPAFLLFGGHQAVLVFFILSGFVLTLMLQRVQSYGIYLWRRFCRLYLPYAVAIALAVVLNLTVDRGNVPDLGVWFNSFWNVPVAWPSLRDHALFVTSFRTGQYDYVIWSLVYEMRISLIFPLVLLMVRHLNWRWSLLVSALASLAAGAVYFLTTHGDTHAVADYALTLHYTFLFVIGAVMAIHRDQLGAWFRQRSRLQKIALVAVGVLSYTYGVIPDRVFGIGNPVLLDWLTLPGAAVMVLLALYSEVAIRFLARPWAQFLGRISYSLYLIHPVVQLGVLHGLAGRVPVLLGMVVAFLITFPLAYLMYRFVELPAIALGRRLRERPRVVVSA